MKQNKYDDPAFFAQYEQMARSVHGLKAAGEWHVLESLMPDLKGKSVLDLGCGFGWHCRYARERGASSVIGVDLSENMLNKARAMTNDTAIEYIRLPIEEISFPEERFDFVLSSLALHYIESYQNVISNIYRLLKPGGTFLFSVEHPVFTSREEQEWHVDREGNRVFWPVDRYQSEGIRTTSFLAENVIKYHRTLSTYLNGLISAGFLVQAVAEPMPSEAMLAAQPEMADEARRPMFLIVSAGRAS
ncbi:class I SAM-dependent methyltransferase [Cohnella thailandensis]|uniref:Class I SAM-dependent methyltransferase n=1 Tax=Cohnella thailandensis TaxID=557557 RepID=A0A841T341_9BACL|nr:class I SAM-dependent methyltransferase [Cohnella thailandensis]MBB6635511.1 class I SAM-dependent methyltransferase [Cohnella thailandensis]MBP1974891.1 ubiquinone/menaquinone biosynthesis C-methylase UbiE [Cohnella thailandensis]